MNLEVLNRALVNQSKSLIDKESLKNVLEKHPYFQAARCIYLKEVFKEDKKQFRDELKICSLQTTDRKILFEFVNSLKNDELEAKEKPKKEIKINAKSELKKEDTNLDLKADEEDNVTIIKKKSSSSLANSNVESQSEKNSVELFSNQEHNLMTWLSVPRASVHKEQIKSTSEIDQIIARIPNKINTQKKVFKEDKSIDSVKENTDLVTETLANIYIKQKKYAKAIQAFKILGLKNPKKSSFFAEKISEIQKLK